MIGLRRTLGLFVSIAAFSSPAFATKAWTAAPDELQDNFGMAIDLLHRGRNDEALALLKKVAAASPDQKAAYELWTRFDYADWRDLLVQGGDFELVARRLIELARVERKERRNDKDAILEQVRIATQSADIVERRAAVRALSADHGEYAAPYLIALLGQNGDEDRRVLAMHALSQMGEEVVVPLAESLRSEDPVQRRNVAFVLGNLASPRAAAALQRAAATDADETVRRAAADSLARMNATGDALSNYLSAGDSYWRRNDLAMRRGEAGEVIWSWKDGQLVGAPIPRALYGSEMSKRAFYDALQVDPSSTRALAGLARAYVDAQTRIDMMKAAGQDVGEWADTVGATLIAVNGAGVDALDLALQSAVKAGDASTGSALCRVLGPLAPAPTTGLQAALESQDGALRSEAGVALGQIAARTGQAAGAPVVSTLGESAAREVLRLVLVIDADAARAQAVAEGLRAMGAYATIAENGTTGLVVLRRSPALDAVLVADSLPDLTTAQVVDEVHGDDRLMNVPVFVLAADKDAAMATYGDRIAGATTGAGDLEPLQAPLTTELQGDRALAKDLASRAATALAALSQGASDLGPALDGLAAATAREDATAIPAIHALGNAGGPGQTGALLAVLADEGRSDDARAAAGSALARIVGRNGGALDADGVAKVQEVVRSQAALPVREAAARVVGSLSISPAERAKLLESLRN